MAVDAIKLSSNQGILDQGLIQHIESMLAVPLAAVITGDSQCAGGSSSAAPSLWAPWEAFQSTSPRGCRKGAAGQGVNWLIMILSDLIFTTIQSKPVSTELPFIECGDPGKCQILVLFRNPKDTAVSFFHFHNNVPGIPSHSSWAELFSECMNGKEPASVKQTAEFFGFSPVAEQIQSTADRATFQAVTDKAQEIRGAGDSFLLCKGVVGDWKNLFTEAQNQEMDAKFKVCLGGTKLGAKLKYDVYCKV